MPNTWIRNCRWFKVFDWPPIRRVQQIRRILVLLGTISINFARWFQLGEMANPLPSDIVIVTSKISHPILKSASLSTDSKRQILGWVGTICIENQQNNNMNHGYVLVAHCPRLVHTQKFYWISQYQQVYRFVEPRHSRAWFLALESLRVL